MTQFFGKSGARNFDPKEAHKRIHKGNSAHWTYNMITKNQNLLFVNGGKAKELEQNYFIAIRWNYLTLRQGERFVIEPYSHHRFSRQFGYYQVVLRVLKCDFRQANLEDRLRYWRLYYFDENLENLISMKPIVRVENNDQDKGANPPIDKDHDVQIVKITESHEANKGKSASHPIEESSTNRHWKSPKRDSKTFKQTEVDGNETRSNQTQAFAKKVIS
ncbi:hypothetical protein CDL12_00626 [Handroanthus impetiginosus]|uniref:Uncharacterized protein n=1 Tax=Handroanthus impetiginosus TaxID=429701 RepID=A0A2G9IA31_9LAMI|nr:hypothetical protein CDL12_00626 [Handroanthus impetiginosus]